MRSRRCGGRAPNALEGMLSAARIGQLGAHLNVLFGAFEPLLTSSDFIVGTRTIRDALDREES